MMRSPTFRLLFLGVPIGASVVVFVVTGLLVLRPMWQQYRLIQQHIEVLKSSKSQAWGHARKGLIEIGSPAVPSLVRLLREKDGNARLAVIGILRELGPKAERALPALIDLLKNGDAELRRQAVETIGRVTRRRPLDAVAALTVALKDKDGRVQIEATRALMRLGSDASPAAAALAEALRDRDIKLRLCAATALGEIGPAAKDAVPALTEALSDRDPSVRWWAAEALKAIDPAALARAGIE